MNALATAALKPFELADLEREEQQQRPKLHADTIGEFLRLDLKPREMVLAPVIAQQGLTMVYSWRGIGKTHIALGMAYAVASGGRFLKWQAPKARPVLYIDGEMPATAMQERLAAIVKSSSAEAAEDALLIVTPDRQDLGIMPNLSTAEGQGMVEQWIDERHIEFVVIDNIATLCRAPKDNETDSWTSMQGWLLRLRRKGISVLLVHHAGKGGAQRGTSSREDVLDTSISLSRPSDYQPSEGCRLEIHYEKARGLFGIEAEPFEAKLEIRDGAAVWTMRDIEDANLARAQAMFANGLTVRDVAEELGISKSSAGRLKKRIEMGDGNEG
jgi:putative DNA primase/helicase